MTFVLGVIGVLVSFRGLKFIIAFNILLDVMGLIRMSIDNVFRVESTVRTSLKERQEETLVAGLPWQEDSPPYLFSCKTPSIRSRSPVASASMALTLSTEWSRGTMFKEMSSGSPRYRAVSVVFIFSSLGGGQGIPTLGSGLMLGVWARITRCANLIQHMRSVNGAVSHNPSTLALIAVIVFHVLVS